MNRKRSPPVWMKPSTSASRMLASRVSSVPLTRLSVAPAAFRAHLQQMLADGATVVPLRSILDGDHDDAARVAITFDDGYASQLEAARVLADLGLPATFFVVAGAVAGRVAEGAYWDAWPRLARKDLGDLARARFEIGAHSASHRRLPACTPAERKAETAGAKARLEDGLGAAVERRQGGRWVPFQDACPRGCPAVGLVARPGETVGPRYGAGLRDNIRIPRTALQGRYRLTKTVARADRPLSPHLQIYRWYLTMALSIAHHGYVMENGRIVLAGSGAELLGNPKVVEAYLGS